MIFFFLCLHERPPLYPPLFFSLRPSPPAVRRFLLTVSCDDTATSRPEGGPRRRMFLHVKGACLYVETCLGYLCMRGAPNVCFLSHPSPCRCVSSTCPPPPSHPLLAFSPTSELWENSSCLLMKFALLLKRSADTDTLLHIRHLCSLRVHSESRELRWSSTSRITQPLLKLRVNSSELH